MANFILSQFNYMFVDTFHGKMVLNILIIRQLADSSMSSRRKFELRIMQKPNTKINFVNMDITKHKFI